MPAPDATEVNNIIPLINPDHLNPLIMSAKFNEALARKSRMLAMTLRDTVNLVGDEFAIKQAEELVDTLTDLAAKLEGTVQGFVEAKEGWLERQEEVKKRDGEAF